MPISPDIRGADLTIATASAASETAIGSSITIRRQLQTLGATPTTPTWDDSVSLSTKISLDPSVDNPRSDWQALQTHRPAPHLEPRQQLGVAILLAPDQPEQPRNVGA